VKRYFINKTKVKEKKHISLFYNNYKSEQIMHMYSTLIQTNGSYSRNTCN